MSEVGSEFGTTLAYSSFIDYGARQGVTSGFDEEV